MSIKERIEADFKAAMKGRDTVRLSCLRMIKAALVNKELEARKELDDPAMVSLLSTLAKKTQESIDQFRAGNRMDLVDKETAELAIIRGYLPEAISEAELLKLIDAAVEDAGALGPKDMGKVMKLLMPKIAGKADGKLVSALVQKKLQCA